MATQEYLVKRSRQRNIDGRRQAHLEDDGGDSKRQSWMETGGPLGETRCKSSLALI